jgi:hypothetical protein
LFEELKKSSVNITRLHSLVLDMLWLTLEIDTHIKAILYAAIHDLWFGLPPNSKTHDYLVFME